MVSEKKYAKKNINIHTESRVRYDDDTQTCALLCASKKSFIVIHHDRDDGIKYNLVYSLVSAAYTASSSPNIYPRTHGGAALLCVQRKIASEEKSSKTSSSAKQK